LLERGARRVQLRQVARRAAGAGAAGRGVLAGGPSAAVRGAAGHHRAGALALALDDALAVEPLQGAADRAARYPVLLAQLGLGGDALPGEELLGADPPPQAVRDQFAAVPAFGSHSQ